MSVQTVETAVQKLDESLKYPLPMSVSSLVRGVRNTVFNSDKSTYSSTGEVITIELAADSFIDTLRSYLTFSFKTIGTNAATTKLKNCTTALFSRIRLLSQNGVVLCDVENQDVMAEILLKNINKEYRTQCLGMANIGVNYDNTTYNDSRTYNLPLFCVGLLSSHKYLPLHVMGGIRMELTLNDPAKCLVYGDNAHVASFEISDVKYTACLVQMSDALNASVKRLVQENQNGLMVPFYDYHHSNFVVPSSSKASYDIRKSANDCRSLFCVVRPLTIAKNAEKYLSVSGSNVSEVQARVGSSMFPRELPLSDSVSQFIEYRKAFNTFQDITRPTAMTFDEYKATQHVVGVDMETLPSSFGSGVSTMKGNILTLDVAHTNNTSVPAQLNTFLLYSKILQILPNKNIVVQE